MICDRLGREDNLGIYRAIGRAEQDSVRAWIELTQQNTGRTNEGRKRELNRGVERDAAGVTEDHRRCIPNQRAGPIGIRRHGLLRKGKGRQEQERKNFQFHKSSPL